MRIPLLASLLALSAPLLRAQSLPAAPTDSIVRLAVDPTAYRGRPYVVLLDEGRYSVEPDGRYVERVRRVFQILDANAVRSMSESSFGYRKSHQTLKLDYARVLRPNGEVISDKPAQEQESDVPAAMSNPIYQDQRVKRVSLSGVAPGTIIDIAFTVEEKESSRKGDFLFQWGVNKPVPVMNTSLTVDTPEGFTPRFLERNLNFRRTEDVAGGRHFYRWVATTVPALSGERFASDSNDVVQSILITSPTTWSDLGRWYNDLARDRYTLSATDAARVDSVVRAAQPRTRTDTIRALHRWITQDIRYLSIALGIGGYQPRMPGDVMSSKFGDCKDKATLFVAALRRYRIPANPVLLSNVARTERRAPSVFQFNHEIAAVGDGASRVFTDLTAEFIPYGQIPDSYQGRFGVLVRPDGSVEEVTFPVSPTDFTNSTMQLDFTIDTSGNLTGNVRHSTTGTQANSMRQALSTLRDSSDRAKVADIFAQQLFPSNARVDSLVLPADRNADTLLLNYHVTATNLLKPVGDTRVFTLNSFFRGPAFTYANLARELKSRPARQFTIDAGQILAPVVTVTDLRIKLPPGWTAELPKNVLATSFFGSYQSTWSQTGQEIRMVRRIQGQRGIFPPQRMVEVISWLENVSQDNYEFLVLHPGTVH